MRENQGTALEERGLPSGEAAARLPPPPAEKGAPPSHVPRHASLPSLSGHVRCWAREPPDPLAKPGSWGRPDPRGWGSQALLPCGPVWPTSCSAGSPEAEPGGSGGVCPSPPAASLWSLCSAAPAAVLGLGHTLFLQSPGGLVSQGCVGFCPFPLFWCVGVTSHFNCPGILPQHLLLGDPRKRASCFCLNTPSLTSQKDPHSVSLSGSQKHRYPGVGWGGAALRPSAVCSLITRGRQRQKRGAWGARAGWAPTAWTRPSAGDSGQRPRELVQPPGPGTAEPPGYA